MKRFILPLFLLILLFYLACGIYFLDKKYFLCPIEYKRDIIARNDNRGEGEFAAPRSGNRLHQGIDLLADVGTPVLAGRSGRVAAAEESRGMGKYVIIKHSQGISTLYGHLSKVFVHQGQLIRQGEVIGCVGKTGNANYRDMFSHLHFEIRKNGVPQNPREYLE